MRWLVWLLVGVWLGWLIYGWGGCRGGRGGDADSDADSRLRAHTEVVTVCETVRVVRPEVRESVVVRWVEVGAVGDSSCRSLSGDSSLRSHTEVRLPVSCVEVGDSDYRVWASGVGVCVDSVWVARRESEVRVVVDRWRDRRWHVGLSAGLGVTRHGVEPFVGVSVTYSFFSF